MSRFENGIFLFHRDFRLDDNSGLIYALEQSKKIFPIFIFDDRQILQNNYRSLNAIQFLFESLKELDSDLQKINHKIHLSFINGTTEQIIKEIITKQPIDAIFCNRDYTPFALQRDRAIMEICEKNKKQFVLTADAMLNEPETVKKADNKPYTVFTPYYKKAQLNPVLKSARLRTSNFGVINGINEIDIDGFEKEILPKKNLQLMIPSGRKSALNILEEISKFKTYIQTHDIPSIHGTTRLSAHLKFGTISIREAYWAIHDQLGITHPLIRQLYWHDFFTQIAYFFPHVFGHTYHTKYENLPWSSKMEMFKAWCNGITGFPIVDAGMRELNTTGFMHNRVRMIVASFLTKDLHIDWRWGEKYFAQHLVDYDPAVNNGNWQWSASTGCDSQPYFRIFNPWTQGEKFDPDAIYIKRWIPELANILPKNIHKLFNSKFQTSEYPKPIIDHAIESKKTKFLYASISQNQKTE